MPPLFDEFLTFLTIIQNLGLITRESSKMFILVHADFIVYFTPCVDV